jgi:hypothetical protein
MTKVMIGVMAGETVSVCNVTLVFRFRNWPTDISELPVRQWTPASVQLQ